MLRIKIENTTDIISIALKTIKKYKKGMIEDIKRNKEASLMLEENNTYYELIIKEKFKVSEGDNE